MALSNDGACLHVVASNTFYWGYVLPCNGGKQGDQFSIVTSTKAVKQGPWGRGEPLKTFGIFDDVAHSIKTVILKYDKKTTRYWVNGGTICQP